MKWKKLIQRSVVIFLLSILCHFIYQFFPSFISSIFFPVNESIFEHLKMLFSSEILFSLITFFFLEDSNQWTRAFLRGWISIFFLLLLYLPVYLFLGEKMIVTFLILFVAILLTEKIVSFLGTEKGSLFREIVFVFLIVLSYGLLGYLTYHPLHEELFFDPLKNIYGISR